MTWPSTYAESSGSTTDYCGGDCSSSAHDADLATSAAAVAGEVSVAVVVDEADVVVAAVGDVAAVAVGASEQHWP